MQAIIFFTMLMASPAMGGAPAKELPTKALLQESDADFEKEAKNRPVSKVITLLKDMVDQLEKEGEEDEEVYETMGCWCVTNEKAKTKSIAEGETKIETLSDSIESLTAQSAKLNTEISTLEAEIKKHIEGLETATSVREKESAEFTEFEKSSLVNIDQLRAGLQALSKLHSAALLKQKSQVSTADMSESDAKKQGSTFSNLFHKVDHFKDIEEEALNPHKDDLKGIPKEYVPEVEKACMKVNQDSVDPSDDWQTGFLQDSKKGTKRPIRSPKHSYKVPKAPSLPSHIQSLLCKALRGSADALLLESGVTSAKSDPSSSKTGLLDTDDSETSNTKYEPASGAIFGILKQMQEDFESNLATAQKGEAVAQDEFDQMKAAITK